MISLFIFLTTYNSHDRIKEDEIGGECGTYEGQTKYIQGAGWGHLKEREQMGDLEVNERVILKWILKKEDGRTCTGQIWLRQGKVTVCS